jgi:hypothetical protein
MIRAVTALLAGLLLAIGIAACGGGNSDTADVVPKSTPDLVAPKDTSLPDVTVDTTSTSATVTTPAAAGATPSGTAVTPSAGTGGTGATGTGGGTSSGTGTTGSGSGSGSGGFGTFCTQNPGAC